MRKHLAKLKEIESTDHYGKRNTVIVQIVLNQN
jgi:hypothetical protein